MPRRSASVELAVEQTEQLDRWIQAGGTPQQVVLRAKIVRQVSERSGDKQIAADLRVHPRTVALWRQRVRDESIEGVWQVAAGRGRKPRVGARQSAARDRAAKPEVKSQPGLCSQAGLDVAQALPERQLSEAQGETMVPRRKRVDARYACAAGPIRALKLPMRNARHDLSEDSMTGVHPTSNHHLPLRTQIVSSLPCSLPAFITSLTHLHRGLSGTALGFTRRPNEAIPSA